MKTKLRVITGLHIGGSDDTMKIGGVDSSVVKREIYANTDGTINYDGTGKRVTEPYIPGSSLKGKIRSLLEHRLGLIAKQKEIFYNQKKKIGQVIDTNFYNKCEDELLKKKANLVITLFGESAGSGDTQNTKITRVIFRDSFLTSYSRKLYLEDKIKLSEEKAENTINRVTVTANPRFMERVPAGVEFEFEVVLREFSEDKDLPLDITIELGLKLLENDALGGGGSRGNGKIELACYQQQDRDINKEIESLIGKIEESLNNENSSIRD
jgi:CRISPR-associated protein Csm3